MKAGKKILFLDDDEGVCILFKKIMEPYPVEVITTGTLEQADELCREHKFDLIILDYNISDGIGWQLARRCKDAPDRYGSPIILLMSGTVTLEDIGTADSFYANCEFLSKPFMVHYVRERIIKLLSKK